MVKIGDRLGRIYDFARFRVCDFFKYYIPFVDRYNIRLINWWQCMEAIKDPNMYSRDGFIPAPNDLIYDVGSQYGDYAILWAKRYDARVYAIEPVTKNYKKLLRNIKANGVNVIPWNIAVGNDLPITYSVKNNMAYPDKNGKYATMAPSLDTIVGTMGIPRIIKIDVEGFELTVLKGAEKTLMHNDIKVIIEAHTAQLKSDVIDFMANIGYALDSEGRISGDAINLFFKKGFSNVKFIQNPVTHAYYEIRDKKSITVKEVYFNGISR